MPLVKESQFIPAGSLSFDGVDVPVRDKNELRSEPVAIVVPSASDIDVEEPELSVRPFEFNLTLDKVPGGLDQEDIEEPEVEVEEPDEVQVSDDPWDWGPVENFFHWLGMMMKTRQDGSIYGIPPHSGRDTVGLERTISHLETLDRCISKVIRGDTRGKLDIQILENARDEIKKGIDSCKERLDKVTDHKYNKGKGKKTKRSEEEQAGLVKEAQKSTHISGITITVPLLISSLARTCINGMVSAGHDIEDMYVKLANRYKLTDREKLELQQLLYDMGYSLRRDLGCPLDEEIDTKSCDNYNWLANYPA